MKVKFKKNNKWGKLNYLKILFLESIKNGNILYVIYPLFVFFLLDHWFYDRTLIANAEQGLHLYNTSKTIEVYKNVWIDIGLGLASPFYISRIPYYYILSFLAQLGTPNWLIQASVLFIVINIALVSVTWLVKEAGVKNEPYLKHIVSIFYFCNLFVLSQILMRNIDSLLFAWSYFPLFIFLWIKWITNRKFTTLIYLLVTTLCFSAIFTLISSLFLFWLTATCCSFFYLIYSKDKRKILFASISGFILWLFINLWWILPILFLKDNSYSEFKNNVNNLSALQEVSKFYPLSEFLLLRQSFYFDAQGPWAVMYMAMKYYYISYVVLALSLIGVYSSIKIKKNYIFILLFIIGFFFCKGANPPFGVQLYDFLFTHISIMQVLRNPYEKLGVMFLLPYSFFVGQGIITLANKLKKTKYISIILLLALCLLLVKPFFSNNMFPSSYHIHVPKYYDLANTYIRRTSTARIFQMPYINDSALHYDWGYVGEEPSEYLFDNSSLAKKSQIPSVDAFYLSLDKYLNNKYFVKLLSLANIDTIVMHNDYLTEVNKVDLKTQAQDNISNWANISAKKTFGKLDVYHFININSPGYIYTPLNGYVVESTNDGFAKVLEPGFNPATDVFILKDTYKQLKSPKLKWEMTSVNYKKKSNSEYHVYVKNSQYPFLLIYNSNFNIRWSAKSNDITFTKHIKVNGFANGWFIDKKGSYIIDITFSL